MEKKLKNFETKHHLLQRWDPESVQYQVVKKTFITKTQSNLLIKIKDLARERWFLLALKAKYAGMKTYTHYSLHLISQSTMYRWSSSGMPTR